MPLSEHEQRLLDQIEQALYAEDPKFALLGPVGAVWFPSASLGLSWPASASSPGSQW